MIAKRRANGIVGPSKLSSVPEKKKKEIIDEVKQLLARNKMALALKANLFLKHCLRKGLRLLAVKAQKKIANAFRRRYYRVLFQKGIFMATLYLETADRDIEKAKQVQVFGNFTRHQWVDRINCEYDEFFKCFKADKVRIMIGH